MSRASPCRSKACRRQIRAPAVSCRYPRSPRCARWCRSSKSAPERAKIECSKAAHAFTGRPFLFTHRIGLVLRLRVRLEIILIRLTGVIGRGVSLRRIGGSGDRRTGRFLGAQIGEHNLAFLRVVFSQAGAGAGLDRGLDAAHRVTDRADPEVVVPTDEVAILVESPVDVDVAVRMTDVDTAGDHGVSATRRK